MKKEIYWYEVIYRSVGTVEWKTCSTTLDTKEEAMRYRETLKEHYPNNEYKIAKTTRIVEEIEEEDI